LVCTSLIGLTTCSKPDIPTTDIVGLYESVDHLQEAFAKRASNKINPGATKDFQVVVTQSAEPIGTLLRSNSSIPISETACKLTQEPSSHDAPGLSLERIALARV
jgi:hypothetical protein